MQRLVDALLTRDPRQRERLAQALLAMALLAAGVAAMHWFVAIGQADAQAVRWWSLFTLAGMVLFFALIRSGLSHRFGESVFSATGMKPQSFAAQKSRPLRL